MEGEVANVVKYLSLGPEGLVAFRMETLAHEIEKEISLLSQILESLCCSKSSRRASGTSTVDQNVKATIAATILHKRCPEMSALAYRTGLVLRHTGAGGLVHLGFVAIVLLIGPLLDMVS